MPRTANHRRSPHHQRGATLIITLVMLVLITLVGLSSLRATTMDEKMAGNARDRDKAFQAAEAAVQFCLGQLKDGTYAGVPLTPAAAGSSQVWDVAANWTNGNSVAVSVDATGLAAQPRCMFESLGAAGSYRVTGQAVGASSQTVVMLQATYTFE
jgi:type IV pilus assembly protein PilX